MAYKDLIVDTTVESRANGSKITAAIWNNTINKLRKQFFALQPA